jgi:energy-coupling factor transporter ATP-binding protein EcfA2
MMDTTLQSIIDGVHPVDLARDEEREFLDSFCEAVTGAGIASDYLDVVNFYVALKSKPLVILYGPSGSGKISLIEQLSSFVKPGKNRVCLDSPSFQMLQGHPWWAESSQNLAVFTDANMRFNSNKLLFLLSEAWHPENKQRLFLACLSRISPAELIAFFSDLASQIIRGMLTHLGEHHLATPIPFPSNLHLIGTMDTEVYRWWEGDLLSQAILIPWKKMKKPIQPVVESSTHSAENIILRSSVRDRQKIYRRIHSLLSDHRQPIYPLLEIEKVLTQYGIRYHPSSFETALAYLANSWSMERVGLFAPASRKNLTISLDIVISQIILPHLSKEIKNHLDICEKLTSLLYPLYPKSTSFIRSLVPNAYPQAVGRG